MRRMSGVDVGAPLNEVLMCDVKDCAEMGVYQYGGPITETYYLCEYHSDLFRGPRQEIVTVVDIT